MKEGIKVLLLFFCVVGISVVLFGEMGILIAVLLVSILLWSVATCLMEINRFYPVILTCQFSEQLDTDINRFLDACSENLLSVTKETNRETFYYFTKITLKDGSFLDFGRRTESLFDGYASRGSMCHCNMYDWDYNQPKIETIKRLDKFVKSNTE